MAQNTRVYHALLLWNRSISVKRFSPNYLKTTVIYGKQSARQHSCHKTLGQWRGVVEIRLKWTPLVPRFNFRGHRNRNRHKSVGYLCLDVGDSASWCWWSFQRWTATSVENHKFPHHPCIKRSLWGNSFWNFFDGVAQKNWDDTSTRWTETLTMCAFVTDRHSDGHTDRIGVSISRSVW